MPALTYDEKLAQLRVAMQKAGLYAYLIPNSDPHQSEYLPEHWRIMPWLTGFTGSSGTMVITQDFAGVWTDSRYFIQAEEQLQESGFELVKLKVPHTSEYGQWLVENAPTGAKIGIDPQLWSVKQVESLNKAFEPYSLTLAEIGDLLELLWTDRPALPQAPVKEQSLKFAGQSRQEKLGVLRERLKKKRADWHLLSTLDDIAWLFNLRGSDVQYNPIFLAFALVGHEEARLYLDKKKISPEGERDLAKDGITVYDYHEVDMHLAAIQLKDVLYFSPANTSKHLAQQWPTQLKTLTGLNLTTELKAIKNDQEVSSLREVMKKDGVALVKFFKWLEESVLAGETVTEVSADAKLTHFRSEQPGFVGPSFGTIAGYGPNGAIVHYSAKSESCATLKAENLFLLDSGGQYLGGTTDITRTVALGYPTSQQQKDFTLVLKGHIGLATAIFPEGTGGHQLDAFARRPLWDHQMNFGHGTGHGVGAYLNVHEGPQRISPSASASYAFRPGMLTSNEPGIYREGEYGIRIENLILCVEAGENQDENRFFQFETLSFCPIDLDLVDKSLLNAQEIEWLNQYHAKVFEALAPSLDSVHQAWLRAKTQAI